MLRVFDPRAQLTPVQVSAILKPPQLSCGSWQPVVENRKIKCSYPTEKTFYFEQTDIFAALFMLAFSVLYSPLHAVINMLTASSPLAAHSSASTIDLWTCYTSCNLCSALPTGTHHTLN